MKTLQRMYLKEFLFLLVLITTVLAVLFSVVSVVEKLDELLPLGLSTGKIIMIGISEIPRLLGFLLPMGALICTIFVLSLASRRNEITIIKASGENLRRFFIPFLVASVVLIPVDFLIAEYISPVFVGNANRIINSSKNSGRVSYQDNNVWFRAKGGTIIRARLFIPETEELLGVSVISLRGGELVKRIEAERGTWQKGNLLLHNTTIYDTVKNTVKFSRKMLIKDIEKPELTVKAKERVYDEMGAFGLIRYRKRLNALGYRNDKLAVDIQSRFSYPLTNLFMLLIGIFLSLKSRHGTGILSAGTGILITLIYWFLFTMSLSLGYTGILPAALSAWTVPVVSSAAAFILLLRTPL